VAGLPFRAVGFAGMKDRHAVTEQWFSLHLPGRDDPAADAFAIDGVEILEQRRHSAKLRIGALRGNRFRIVIHDLTGDITEFERRLHSIRDNAVPNYYGAQRFGRGGGNLDLFGDLAQPAELGRESRSFALSALRSALFNNYLAQRIAEDTVSTWGAGESRATGAALEQERSFFAQYPATSRLLAAHDVRMMRRPLLIRPQGVDWHMGAGTATLEFALGRGQFATAVLRECLRWSE